MAKKEVKNIIEEKPMPIVAVVEFGTTEIRAIAVERNESPEGNISWRIIAKEKIKAGEFGWKAGNVCRAQIKNAKDTALGLTTILNRLSNVISSDYNKGKTEDHEKISVKFKKVYVTLNGRGITTHHCTITRRLNGEIISESHIKDIENECKASAKGLNKAVLQLIPIKYLVDDEICESPIGCQCEVIQATYSVIVGDQRCIDDLDMVMKLANVELAGWTLVPIAAAEAYLGKGKGLGNVVIDFGAESTSIIIYYQNAMHFCYILPGFASNAINEVLMKMNIIADEAEKLKRKFANCSIDNSINDVINLVESKKEVSKQLLANISQNIVDKICDYIDACIDKTGLKPGTHLESISIVGRGCQLRGLPERLTYKLGIKTTRVNICEKYAKILGLPEIPDELNKPISELSDADKKRKANIVKERNDIQYSYANVMGALTNATESCFTSKQLAPYPQPEKKEGKLQGILTGFISDFLKDPR